MKNNKNRDMRPPRIMHVIFSKKYLNQEQMSVALINRQINNYAVAVCIRSDCDAYYSRSLLNYLDPQVEIFRIPAYLRFIYLLHALMVWRPTQLHWHNLKPQRILGMMFWRITQISTQYTPPNRSQRRVKQVKRKEKKSEPAFNSPINKSMKFEEMNDMSGRRP